MSSKFDKYRDDSTRSLGDEELALELALTVIHNPGAYADHVEGFAAGTTDILRDFDGSRGGVAPEKRNDIERVRVVSEVLGRVAERYES